MLDKLLATACLTVLTAGVAFADDHGDMAGDPEKGERTFRKCMACHAVGEDAKVKTGPVLNGIVGKDIASTEDFDYSDALMELEGEWTPEALAGFLEKPRDYASGTKMSFAGLRKEDERADVIAYLAQFNADGTMEGM
ncbi:cytochrome c [Salipiger pallidus]|uniref:Cytochrome c n=1 Tax=Salipiger pallidus TaxID=1775170 RepID=A0A8J3EHP0_9RHOB|nr:cytochrome c family protein [Salipiger pallidus]GGG79678.1 cytochrome c [Salipiger pallidus]